MTTETKKTSQTTQKYPLTELQNLPDDEIWVKGSERNDGRTIKEQIEITIRLKNEKKSHVEMCF